MTVPPDNVIRLAFRRRAMGRTGGGRAEGCRVPSFTLTAADGRWALEGPEGPPDAAGLMAAADTLRDIARALTVQAHAQAGQPPNRCLAEFVLYQDGGIDHWLVPSGDDEDRRRIALGLCNAIGSLRR